MTRKRLALRALATGGLAGFLFLSAWNTGSAQAPAVVARITVEGASATWSATLAGPEAARPAAQAVAPRIVTEYAAASSRTALARPVAAEQAAQTVAPRIIVDYASASSLHGLQHPWPVVLPPPPPAVGALRVAPGEELLSIAVNAPRSVLLLVDASGSMDEVVEGVSKIEIARARLLEIVGAMPSALEVGLLVFKDCGAIELAVPVGPLDRKRLADVIHAIRPVASTPIAGAIAMVPSAMAGRPQPYLVILLTDGMETCGGDPVHAARDLMARGYDLRMHVIGYDVAQYADAQRQLRQIAAEAGGSYFDATTTEELRRALVLLTPVRYTVYSNGAVVVGDGVVGDDPRELPVGSYRVVIQAAEGDLVVEVVVKEKATTTVWLDHVRGSFRTRVE